MSKIALTPNASGTGTFTIASPNSNTDRTLTLPDAAGTVFLENGSGTIAPTNISDGTLSIPTTYVTNGSAKAWVNFDGTAGTLAPRDSLNVSTLTDNGTGNYTFNLTNAMSSTSFSAVSRDDGWDVGATVLSSVSAIQVVHRNNSFSTADVTTSMSHILGDLA